MHITFKFVYLYNQYITNLLFLRFYFQNKIIKDEVQIEMYVIFYYILFILT